MNEIAAQIFKDSVFAGFLGVVLLFLLRSLDRRLVDLAEIGLCNQLMVTQLSRAFEAHDITVTGINPSVDLTEISDDRIRSVLAKYKSIDERLASIESEILNALSRVRGNKK